MTDLIKKYKMYFVYGGLFSFFINLFGLTFSVYMLEIYDNVLTSYSLSSLKALTIVAVFSLCIFALLFLVRGVLMFRLAQAFSFDSYKPLYNSYFMPGRTPQVVAATASAADINKVNTFIQSPVMFSVFDSPFIFISLGVIAWLNFTLGLVGLAIALLFVVSGVYNERIIRKPIEMALLLKSVIGNITRNFENNAESILAMGMLKNLSKRLSDQNDKAMAFQIGLSSKSVRFTSLTKFLMFFSQVAIYAAGAYLTLSGVCSPGIMIAGAIIIGKALQPIQGLIGGLKNLKEAMVSMDKVGKLAQQVEMPKMRLPDTRGELSTEFVSYAAGGRMVLQNITFSLAGGESMGIIGPSGSGKSSLCEMLLGVNPPAGGKVRVDGADLADWDMTQLGRDIGYLPQEIPLLPGTLAENIGRFDPDMEMVEQAAKLAGVHERIMDFPDGYDTEVTDNSAILSGGIRQRLGLARAFYGWPKIIVLDEPNSNLDNEGEQVLAHAFQALKGRSTLVVVTHRPNMLYQFDKLMVLKNGTLAMFGPTQEVLKQLMGQGKTQGQPAARRVVS